MPKLSVIVPVYNTEKYLRECIDSILAQTFTDFELILVDDGSTDGSGSICDEYASRDKRIQVIHQQNGGVTKARKAAMRIATGSWISFIDSDDWIDSAMFEIMLDKALSGGAQIVICDAVLHSANKTHIAGNMAEEGFYDKAAMEHKIYSTMIMDFSKRRPGISSSLCNKIFDKALLDTVFWDVDDSFVYAEDALCCYAAILECSGIFICRKPLYFYRQHMSSAMHQYNGKKRYANLLRSYTAHEVMLQVHGPVYQEQLNDFIAVNTITNLRNALLFDKKTSLRIRLSQAKEFVTQAIIVDAFKVTINKYTDGKEQLKAFLALHKCIEILYMLFAVRELMLNFGR